MIGGKLFVVKCVILGVLVIVIVVFVGCNCSNFSVIDGVLLENYMV